MKKMMFFILFLLSCSAAHAQGKFSGTVNDKTTGLSVPNVNIFISELNSGSTSDSSGHFHFNSLPSGKFHVQFSHIGYGSYVTLINTNADVQLDVQLVMTAIETDEIVITAPYNSSGDKTAYNIDVISKDDMRASGSLTLTGAISEIPGVYQLSLGSGITKPIIRGLRSNRVLTVLNGFRFDNQQWQDEHGLGLSDMGIARVEVIKGAASVLYGSDAMGGVINLVEEEPAPIGKTVGAYSMKFNTNTLQVGSEITVKGASEKMNWKINAGGESNTNYLDAKKQLAFNTRFNGGAVKIGLGFTRKKAVTSFNYNFSSYSFGFVDAGEFNKPSINFDEERYSRTMEDAYHTVQYNLLYNKTTFFLKNSRIAMDVGAHFNHRMEQEGAEEKAIGNMDIALNNYSLNLRWIKTFKEKHEFILGTQDMLVTNINKGKRFIIPDATSHELSGYAFLKSTFSKIIIEEGLRFNSYAIASLAHGNSDSLIAKSNAWMPAFNKNYSTVNGSIGFAYSPFERILIKLNLSSGYRAPNLAELSANGFHEGFVYYEQGNANLKNEQNFEGDLSIRIGNGDFKIEGATFYNNIINYIYLAPSDSILFNRFVFFYKQTDALLYGAEAGFDWEPEFAKWLDLKSNYSSLIATDKNNDYIPLMPADRIRSDIKIRFKDGKKFSSSFVMGTVTNVLEQARIASAETITPAYTLVDFSAGGTIAIKKGSVVLSIFCNNAFNAYYFDHLSLVKPGTMPGGRGFYGMGRNFGMVIKIPFGKTKTD